MNMLTKLTILAASLALSAANRSLSQMEDIEDDPIINIDLERTNADSTKTLIGTITLKESTAKYIQTTALSSPSPFVMENPPGDITRHLVGIENTPPHVFLKYNFEVCLEKDALTYGRDPASTANTLAAIQTFVDWAEVHKNVKPAFKYKDEQGKVKKYEWTDEQRKFVPRDYSVLFPLLRASHFHSLAGLLNILVDYVASKLKGLTLDQIRVEFALPWEKERIVNAMKNKNLKANLSSDRSESSASTSMRKGKAVVKVPY